VNEAVPASSAGNLLNMQPGVSLDDVDLIMYRGCMSVEVIAGAWRLFHLPGYYGLAAGCPRAMPAALLWQ
jgi:hypothetical protein